MPNPIELKIGTVSKPVKSPSITYRISTSHVLPGASLIPAPTRSFIDYELLGGRFVVGPAQMAYNRVAVLGSNLSIVSAKSEIWLSNPTDPRCNWRIIAQNGDIIVDMPNGLLPIQYNDQYYTLDGVISLMVEGDYAGALLYTADSDGKIISVSDCGAPASINGNRSPIKYKARVIQKFEPYETITVEGTSLEYNVPNSPFGASVVISRDLTVFKGGEKHGTVIMTETPEN